MIEKEKRLIYAFMVLVLICLLFFSSVAFGQVTPPQYNGSGRISGTIFYNDGVTPFFLNNSTGRVEITNATTNVNVALLYTDSAGHYISSYLPAGNYQVHVGGVSGNSIVSISNFYNVSIISGQVATVNVTTSRMLTNYKTI
jgi:hypothetical protein